MIYLDNAATTKPYQDILEKAVNFLNNNYYNPSSVYNQAFEVKKLINEKRNKLAKLMGVSLSEITFTSGATESNNIFIRGIATSNKKEEYIFSASEHASIYEVANNLKSKGYAVHFAPLKENGQVDIKALISLVNENTRLVSIIHVNNETGAINDIKKITQLVKQKNAKTLVHADGVQAFSKIAFNLLNLGVDAYTISGHKLHALKGIGALYIRKGINIKPIIFGGGQEGNKRSGTENVLGIITLVDSIERMASNMENNLKLITSFKEEFLEKIKSCQEIIVHSNNYKDYSPYIISLSVLKIKSEILVHMLAKEGVLVSTGSSCSSNKKQAGNRVLEAMGASKEEVLGSIRVSFSEFNTIQEVKKASKIFVDTVKKLKEKIS